MHSVFDTGACLRLYQIKQIHNQLLPVDISEMEKKSVEGYLLLHCFTKYTFDTNSIVSKTLQFNTVPVITHIKLQ